MVRGAVFALALAVAVRVTWEGALRVMPYRTSARMPAPATHVLNADGQEMAAFISVQETWCLPLPSEELSPWLKKAIVAVEDRRFYDHGGVDWMSVIGAAWEDATSLHIRRGASTLTMQVERLREPRARTLGNKLEQAFRAAQLDRATPKDALLTEYLNRAPFGGNLVGAGAASWRYFGRKCSDLSLAQAALLAGLPQSPNRLRPDRHPDAALARRHHVLAAMRETGAISDHEFTVADGEPLEARWLALPQRAEVDGALPALAGAAARHPEEIVRTTLEPRVQRAAYTLTHEHLATLRAAGVDSAAVVVVDVATGHVTASVSLSARAGALDLTRAKRSTGSLLKPFIYAAAFREGLLAPGDVLFDSPKAWAGYVPVNFDREYRGALTAAEALAQSRNIPAMTVLAKVGVDEALATMERAGIRTPSRSHRDYGLALAIGGAEATPLEIAEAYATMARGGRHLEVTLLAAGETEAVRVLPESVAAETLACLAEEGRTLSVEGGEAAAARGAAWKTGTSSDLRDAWCAAVTPRVAVVVWLGNADGHESPSLVGLDAAAPLALRIVGAVDGAAPGHPWTLVKRPGKLIAGAEQTLAVVSPPPGAELFLEDGGRVMLQATGGAGDRRWWFANGELVGVARAGERVTWRPGKGAFALRVVDAAGTAASVHVRVRG
jgi:penicillin-binding protein 1C